MVELNRRHAIGLFGAGVATAPLWAQAVVDLGLPGGNGTRPLTDAFPGKRGMILQRTRAPLLETPLSAFDDQVFTPNDRFFVRWHYDDIPLSIDPAAFRLTVGGAVKQRLSLSLADLVALPRVELAAVNQCSGNSRGEFSPRVPGAQWGNGAMGNARWGGVRLKDVLDKAGIGAGIGAGAAQVRFAGLDNPPGDAPRFAKSLDLPHAMDGEVMIAFQMNGAQLPLLNGFPLRLVVPGWYSTYWVKALNSIEVLGSPDTGYWMDKAYRIPAAAHADVLPGAKDFPTVPINRMVPRSFVTNLAEGARVKAGVSLALRGIGFGGATGVARIDVSADGGKSWIAATLGRDEGKYSFRLWQAALPALPPGAHALSVRCSNTAGEVQGVVPIWNPPGFMRNPIETLAVIAA